MIIRKLLYILIVFLLLNGGLYWAYQERLEDVEQEQTQRTQKMAIFVSHLLQNNYIKDLADIAEIQQQGPKYYTLREVLRDLRDTLGYRLIAAWNISGDPKKPTIFWIIDTESEVSENHKPPGKSFQHRPTPLFTKLLQNPGKTFCDSSTNSCYTGILSRDKKVLGYVEVTANPELVESAKMRVTVFFYRVFMAVNLLFMLATMLRTIASMIQLHKEHKQCALAMALIEKLDITQREPYEEQPKRDRMACWQHIKL